MCRQRLESGVSLVVNLKLKARDELHDARRIGARELSNSDGS